MLVCFGTKRVVGVSSVQSRDNAVCRSWDRLFRLLVLTTLQYCTVLSRRLTLLPVPYRRQASDSEFCGMKHGWTGPERWSLRLRYGFRDVLPCHRSRLISFRGGQHWYSPPPPDAPIEACALPRGAAADLGHGYRRSAGFA